MKKIKLLSMLLIVSLFSVSTNVKAANVTEEEFAKLNKMFSDARIAVMSDEEADKYLSYDLDNVISAKKHFKIIDNLNNPTLIEVTEEEYENGSDGITPYGAFHETPYKMIQIAAVRIGTSNRYAMSQYMRWKAEPAVKSFDVSAMRFDDATYVAGTQDGTQIFWNTSTNGYDMIDYKYNGTNIVNKTNGFGISMNLVDSSSFFECDLTVDAIATTEWATAFGSYQHAKKKVTLAQSQNYNISHNGYGEVINFATSVQNYYDDMDGVSIKLDYTP